MNFEEEEPVKKIFGSVKGLSTLLGDYKAAQIHIFPLLYFTSK